MKLVKTDLYLLLIDEEAEIKEWDLYYDLESKLVPIKQSIENSHKDFKSCKIIAYYPLSKDAQELDLPLLPNPFENNFDLKQEIIRWYHSKTGITLINDASLNEIINKAQSKQFSLEDIKKAIEMAREADSIDGIVDLHIVLNYPNADNSDLRIKYIEEEIIQALSTQQLPKEFIPEYDLMNEGYNKPEDYPYQECKVLKTIINPEGRRELVGTYKY